LLVLIELIGVLLSDLTVINDVNGDVNNERPGLVNFDKLRLLYKALETLRAAKKHRYTFEKLRSTPLIDVDSVATITEEDLYQKSLTIEPKDAKRSDIL
jgi:hypothetical protein